MPAANPPLEWITSQLYPDGVPGLPRPPSTDFLRNGGDNPRLTAYVSASLEALAAQNAPQPGTPDAPPRALTQAEVDTWSEPERRAWEILTAPGQQQALIDGDPEVTAHFHALARIYGGEVIDET